LSTRSPVPVLTLLGSTLLNGYIHSVEYCSITKFPLRVTVICCK
jgi:hypothetical protein